MSVVAAAPANATIALKLKITNALGDYLQVPEVEAYSGATNVAASLNGGTAVGAVSGTWNSASIPAGAIDGIVQSTFNFNPGPGDVTMYHPTTAGGANALIVTFAALSDITKITIYGRTDCCSNRDLYNYQLLDAADTVVASGQLDARATNVASAVLPAVPEPATWAMMMVGFGVLGFGLRRRNSADSRVSFKFA